VDRDNTSSAPIDYIDFCGEIYALGGEAIVTIGRGGSLVIDDNPYLHRRFLEISIRGGFGWIANVGSALSATVADEAGLMQAWLAPGAQLPIVFAKTIVWFTAGPTTYEFDVVLGTPPFAAPSVEHIDSGSTTIGRMSFTPDQRLLIIALAENVLRRGNRGAGTIPASGDAAARLGWSITKFNRKLDNVCDKLNRSGIRGLHGAADKLATSRRARLVEYALAARLIDHSDLALLDLAANSSKQVVS
jgi:hypothetical protein